MPANARIQDRNLFWWQTWFKQIWIKVDCTHRGPRALLCTHILTFAGSLTSLNWNARLAKITWIVTVQKSYFRILHFPMFPVCKRHHNLKIRSSKNPLGGHTLLPTLVRDVSVTWSTGVPKERGSRKYIVFQPLYRARNPFCRLFRRSKLLRLEFFCENAKFKTEWLSPFSSHFRREWLPWLRPSVRRSVQNKIFCILK